MNIHDLLKPGTVTVITDSPEHAAVWAAGARLGLMEG